MRPRIAVAIVAAVALIVLALAATALASSQATHPKLLGVVGKNDAFKISLTSKGTTSVKTLNAGTYRFVIQDDSTIHNYELDGPNGKSWDFTSVGFKGTKTLTIKLAKGQYKAYCSPHESFMFQHFTVV
jgi:plastocyanin